jgi:hypothetical protein
MCAPLLVAVDESGRDCPDVRAGTNQEENDKQEGLEIEERGLKRRVRFVSRVCMEDGKTREE